MPVALADEVDRLAEETAFSGVVRVDRDGDVELRSAWGMADRAAEVAMTVDTQLGLASGGKAFTALTVLSLVEDDVFDLTSPARRFLGSDLPLVGDVTIEQLLDHTSGIGDYVDEDVIASVEEHVLTVPLHELRHTEAFLPMLDGLPPKHAPGDGFSYCNGGYVVLALVVERATGVPYHDLVLDRVCRRAGLGDTAFLCSDDLPPGAARGYLDAAGCRTNVLHLPVRGSGDGGIYSTVDDLAAFWAALFEGRIVSPASGAEMTRARSIVPEEGARYGLGFWVHAHHEVPMLIGSDAGVSFWSAHDPAHGTGFTVIGNTSMGAWPLARHLGTALFPS